VTYDPVASPDPSFTSSERDDPSATLRPRGDAWRQAADGSRAPPSHAPAGRYQPIKALRHAASDSHIAVFQA